MAVETGFSCTVSGMREPGVKIQDLWYSTKDGKADLGRPTARKGRGKRYRLNIVDPQGNCNSEHYATKKEAENRQKELSHKLFTGTYASREAGRVTFGDVAEQWYTSKEVRLKGKTLEGYRSMLAPTSCPSGRTLRWVTSTGSPSRSGSRVDRLSG